MLKAEWQCCYLKLTYERKTESNTTTPGFIGKDPDARENGGHQEKGATEDKMVGWHYLLNIHEFE